MSDLQSYFRNKGNQLFQGVTLEDYQVLWSNLQELFHISVPQIVEASSLAMAMVSRYALGLSSQGGKVFAFVDDSPAGWVALATMRHLTNGGCDAAVLTYLHSDSVSDYFMQQAKSLHALNVPIESFDSISRDEFLFLLDSCHNIVCGLYGRQQIAIRAYQPLIETFNESRISVHCIEAPLGVDVNSGLPLGQPLFASSTLSLGIPLVGLIKGQEYVGRHYVADISIPREFYRFSPEDAPPLFCEQPVVQIHAGSNSEEKINLESLRG